MLDALVSLSQNYCYPQITDVNIGSQRHCDWIIEVYELIGLLILHTEPLGWKVLTIVSQSMALVEVLCLNLDIRP